MNNNVFIISLSLYASITLYGCIDVNKKNYSLETNYIKQKESAKYMLYKANSYLNCNCIAIKPAESEEDTQDTLSVLSLAIEFDTIEFFNDTTIYYFNYRENDKPNNKYYVSSSPYNGCSHYYGVAYSSKAPNNDVPIFLLVQENAFVELTTVKLQEINLGFEKCINKKSNINPWLIKYIDSSSQ